jgi:hypothetical protein
MEHCPPLPEKWQYWHWAATVGTALDSAKKYGVRYCIYKQREKEEYPGPAKGMWVAILIKEDK